MNQLSLAVSKGTAYGEAPREHAIGPNEWVLVVVAIFLLGAHWLPNLLCHGRRQSILHHCLCLVNVAARVLNALELTRARRLMIV